MGMYEISRRYQAARRDARNGSSGTVELEGVVTWVACDAKMVDVRASQEISPLRCTPCHVECLHALQGERVGYKR